MALLCGLPPLVEPSPRARHARQAGGHWFEPSTAHVRNPLLIVARGPEPAFEFERRRSRSGSPRLDRGAPPPPRGPLPFVLPLARGAIVSMFAGRLRSGGLARL